MHLDTSSLRARSSEQSPWPKGTAGHRMTAHVLTARSGQTVREVRSVIEREIARADVCNYVYVLDDERHLAGVLSLKELYNAELAMKVGGICRREQVLAVRPTTEQERVAFLALQHNIKAVPVTDHDHTLLGVVSGDAILHILHHEVHDDLLHFAGIVHRGRDPFDNILTLPILASVRHRLPWLFLGLLGGLAAAQIIGFFEQTLGQHLLLAAFIPLLVYMSDAARTQMEAFMIRDLAVDHALPFLRYFGRQLCILSIIAALFGCVLFAVSYVLHGQLSVSIALGLSLFAATISSVATGLVIPYVFSRLRLDPANASGPTATIVQDVVTIILYLSIATLLL